MTQDERAAMEANVAPCEICGGGGWVCEAHPDQPSGHGDCGIGMLCVCRDGVLPPFREDMAVMACVDELAPTVKRWVQ